MCVRSGTEATGKIQILPGTWQHIEQKRKEKSKLEIYKSTIQVELRFKFIIFGFFCSGFSRVNLIDWVRAKSSREGEKRSEEKRAIPRVSFLCATSPVCLDQALFSPFCCFPILPISSYQNVCIRLMSTRNPRDERFKIQQQKDEKCHFTPPLARDDRASVA